MRCMAPAPRGIFVKPLVAVLFLAACAAACAGPTPIGAPTPPRRTGTPVATATASTAHQSYPHLWPTAKATPFIVVGCKFADVSGVPAGLLDQATRFLTASGSGMGNMLDYYSDVSYGAISLAGSRVMGWYNMPLTLASFKANPRERQEGARECAEAVPQGAVDFSKYYGLIALVNAPTDNEGACAIGQTALTIHGHTYSLGCDVFDPQGLFTGFAAHEIGHALGLQHSWDNNKQYCSKTGHFTAPPSPGEYCDPWDVMSALNSYRFDGGRFPTATGKSKSDGPGLNVPNLLKLGWMPGDRIAVYHAGDPATTYTLAALSHPNAKGDLTVEVDAEPPATATGYYTVEYRQQDGWDAGIPDDTVLIHEFRKAAAIWSYLQRTPPPNAHVVPGEWLPGMTWVAPDSHIQVRVDAIDPAAGTATITVGPEGSS